MKLIKNIQMTLVVVTLCVLGFATVESALGAPDNAVIAWGDNRYGQTDVPADLTNAVAIAARGLHSLALKSDNTVVAWGTGPTAPGDLTTAVAIAAGSLHCLALRSDTTVVAWGGDVFGQIDVPAELTNVTAIAAGGKHSLALLSDTTVVGWGDGSLGQTDTAALTNVAAIAAGHEYSLALLSDSTVVGLGDNTYGQTDTAGLTNVTAIAAGLRHCLALLSDSTVVAWGDGNLGQTNIPGGLTNVVAIAAGDYHCLALKSDGTVVGWGRNSYDQTTLPDGLTNVSAIAGGNYHSVVINNGSVAITKQPSGLSRNAGESASFTVVVGGSSLTYQWRRDGTNLVDGDNISGATTATLDLLEVFGPDAGSYDVVITNSLGSITSLAVTLTVNDPVITSDPGSQSVNLGDPAIFTVEVAGTPTLGYQWLKNGTNLVDGGNVSGTTTATLTLTNVGLLDVADYSVVVSNVFGVVTSGVATLSMGCMPITLDPTTLPDGNLGISYNQTITAIGGTEPYTYALTDDSLPAGLSLASDGALTGNPFAIGTNLFTVTATDANGCTGSADYTLAITASGSPLDINKPTVTITSPKNKATVTEASIPVSGTAKDSTSKPNTGAALVLYSVNGGPQQLASTASKFTNWTATVNLNPGTNIFTAQSFDYRGNASISRTNSYFYKVPLPLTVITNGIGNVSIPDGSNLAINVRYTIMATPGENYLFSNWLASVDGTPTDLPTNAVKYSFYMQTNLTLTANFVTNRFLGAAGTYYGLFSDPEGAVSHQTAGYIQITVKPGKTAFKQTFSGSMLVQGEKVAFSGTFDSDLSGKGHLKQVATRKRSGVVIDTFDVVVDLNLANGTVITGTVTNLDAHWGATFEANRNVYAARTDAPMASSYTLVLPPSGVTGEPGGYGHFCMNLTTNGLMKPVAGRIGDGFKPKVTSVGISEAAAGKVPFYASAYKQTDKTYGGSVWGWLYFTNGVVGGQLTVNKLVGVPTTVWATYADGFTNAITVQGSGFTNTIPALVPLLNFTLNDGQIVFEGGMLGGSTVSTNFTLDPLTSKVTFAKGQNPNKISLTLKTTGQMTGSFMATPPDKASTRAFEGAILQNLNKAFGVFPTAMGTDTTSGSVTVEQH